MAAVLKTYAGLDRSIYYLFIAQVVNSIGHFVHPFLALLLTQKLGMDAGEAGFYVFLSALAWVPNGSTLAVGRADGTIDVVAVAPTASALATARTLRRHGARVRALAWLPPPHGLGSGRPEIGRAHV